MRVSLWQQFSSNHSANFTLVGSFETPEQAQAAAYAIQKALGWETGRQRLLWGSSAPSAEWAAPSIEEEYRRLNIVGRTLLITGGGSIDDALPLSEYLCALGGGVLADDGADSSGWTMRVALECVAPDQAAAKAIQDELNEYFLLYRQTFGPWGLEASSDGAAFEASFDQVTFNVDALWNHPLAPFAPDTGHIRQTGEQLHFTGLRFNGLARSFPDFLNYLKEKGCSRIRYSIAPGEATLEYEPGDPGQQLALSRLRDEASGMVDEQGLWGLSTLAGIFETPERASSAAQMIREALSTGALPWKPLREGGGRTVTSAGRAVFVTGGASLSEMRPLRDLLEELGGHVLGHGADDHDRTCLLTADVFCLTATSELAEALAHELQGYLRQRQQNLLVPLEPPWGRFVEQPGAEPADMLAAIVRQQGRRLRFEGLHLYELAYGLPAFVAYLEARGCSEIGFVFEAHYPDIGPPESDEGQEEQEL